MKCPVCRNVYLEPAELETELVTQSCGQCGGHYVKAVRYLSWLERHGENLAERPAEADALLPVNDSKPGKLCPECGAFLIRHKVGHGVAFHLDRCGRCGGIWLDGNEWEALKARNLHDDVHLVFSEAWQAQVKGEQRSREYREVVTGILDEKLRQACTEEDLTRLKQFKQWLDGHPRAAELYAYLTSTRDL